MRSALDGLGIFGTLIAIFMAGVWIAFPLFVMAKLNQLITEQRKTNSLLSVINRTAQPKDTPPNSAVYAAGESENVGGVIVGVMAVILLILGIAAFALK